MYYYRDALSRERDRSLEGWLELSYDLGPFSLIVNPSIDVLTYRGAYFVDTGIESEGHVSSRLELGGSLRAGWASWRFNNEYAGVAKSTLDRARAATWLNAYLTPHLYIGPHLEYNLTLDRDVRAVTGANYLLLRVALGGEF
jgi:outer membrane scaffolding protein for murein synthesis (MipA/OmpV family)